MMENNDNKILITAIGTINGTAVIEELRKLKDVSMYIIGANSTPASYVVNSKYVDEYVEFPSAIDDREAYLDYVIDFCKKKYVTHVFCFIDEEVESFSKNKNRFDEINVTLCLAEHKVIEVCHFKNLFSKWVRDNIPEIWIKEYSKRDNIDKNDYPLFVKPIEGRASIGCKSISDQEELKIFMNETNGGEGFIIQKLVSGDVVGVDIIRNRKYNQLVIIQKKELMRNSNGCGTVVEIINDSRINSICTRIAEKLDLNGIVNAEFFVNEDDIKIIEINPRLPAGTAYSCMAGANTVINALLIAEGKPCEFENIKIGTIYARRYETYEM